MAFDADIGGVRSAGEDACALAERLRAVRSSWDGETREGESAVGLPVACRAFRELQDTWFIEVGAHITVLAELCQALRDSADTYRRTDQAAAQGFGLVTDDGK